MADAMADVARIIGWTVMIAGGACLALALVAAAIHQAWDVYRDARSYGMIRDAVDEWHRRRKEEANP